MKKILLTLLFLCSNAFGAGLFDGKYGQQQVFDVARSGCTTVGGPCTVSNMINPFLSPYTNWVKVTWATGDYVQFYNNGASTNSVGMKQYSSDGTFKTTVSSNGYVMVLGSGIVYIGHPNSGGGTGYFISNSTGYAYNSSTSVTVETVNPTITQLNSYGATTTPLATGQTAPPVPTVTGTSTSYTTRNVVSGNTTTVYRTPVTTTTYSNGTSTNANGTEALYQTRVSSAVVTNSIVSGVMTTYSTPVVKVTTVGGGASTLQSNGSQTATTQNVNQGLNVQVFRYDALNYNCILFVCAWNFTYHTPSTNINDYGTPVNSYRATNGMFFSPTSNLPNNDISLIGRNDGTVIRFSGTITAPSTATRPAGTVYRLYFYNNSDDGFKMWVNGGQIINQDTTVQYQSTYPGTTGSGYIDVVAGQTYNLEAWYWNTFGGLGHTLHWDFGGGFATIPNSAFTDGTIGNIDIDLTGLSYSNPAIVPIEGTASSLWPESEGITYSELLQKNAAKGRVANITLGNHLYLDQKIGSSGNAVTIEQTGNYNKISGLGGTGYAVIDGDNNVINIKQGDTIGKNLIEFSIIGNTNNVSIWQARNPTTGLQDGQESGGHYMGLNINGSTNTLSLKQSNDGGTTSGHFAYVDVTGNNNNGTLKQMGNGEKTFFGIVNGNTNVFDITQQGTGSFLDLSLTGNGHNVTANQKDAGSHKATVNLTNSGGSSTVNLIQQGSVAQSINITQQCATLAGCSVSVTQGTVP